VRGATTLEDADFSYADLRDADFRRVQVHGAIFADSDPAHTDLRSAILTGCVLNRASLHNADLRGAVVWGTSVWDTSFDATTKQHGLLIGWDDLNPPAEEESALRSPGQSLVVNDIRVAHFMSLVRKNDDLAEVFDAASNSMVLLLGRSTDGQENVLDALREALPRFGYAPVVFDFREPRDRDLIETVATLAGRAKFIIADLSRPRSTPLESQLTIPQIAIPWVPIIRWDEEAFSMFHALQRKYEWVLPTLRYRSVSGLIKRLEQRVIRPAEVLSARLRAMKHPRERT